MKANGTYFGFSNLPENHRLFDPNRANLPALFKIEDPNLKLSIGLCAKVYWLSGSEGVAKGKGAMQALRQKMTGKHYLNALREPMTLALGDAPAILGQMGPVTSIRSRNHEATTETSTRVGFAGLQTKMERVGPFEFLPFLSFPSFCDAVAKIDFRKLPEELLQMYVLPEVLQYLGDEGSCQTEAVKLLLNDKWQMLKKP